MQFSGMKDALALVLRGAGTPGKIEQLHLGLPFSSSLPQDYRLASSMACNKYVRVSMEPDTAVSQMFLGTPVEPAKFGSTLLAASDATEPVAGPVAH